jgi:protein TonB
MDFAHQQKTPNKRFGGLFIVIVLHVVIVYALATGLARKVVEVIQKPLETKVIEEMKKPDDTPPPPPPKLAAPPPPFVPPPEINIQTAVASPNAIAAVTSTPPPVQAAAPTPTPLEAPRAPVRTAPVVDSRSCKTPEYPSASKRLEETGTVVLNFLIGADGSVLQSKVESSSGHERLDEAARAALSLCKFKPGTVDGKAEESWHNFKYVWKLDR